METNSVTKSSLISILAASLVGGAVGYRYFAHFNTAPAFPTQMTTASVSAGTIQSISGNIITMQTSSSESPFVTTPTLRKITVTTATKILESKRIDPGVYRQEMAAYGNAFQKAAASPTTVAPPAMPVPVIQTALTLPELKAGDMILVGADKDVLTSISFVARTITVFGTVIH